MVISHKYKFVFMHIPKTGGSSITYSLIRMCKYDKDVKLIPAEEFAVFKNAEIFRNSNDIAQHSHYGDIKLYLEQCGKNIDNYFVFTFVRNPWTRYVSSYEYGRRSYIRCYKYDWAKPAYDNDFDTWLKNTAHDEQQNWIKDFPLNYIGKMENMQFHLEEIRQILQTRMANVELDKVKPSIINANPHADYKTYYTEETKTLVAKRCYQTINDFNYEF